MCDIRRGYDFKYTQAWKKIQSINVISDWWPKKLNMVRDTLSVFLFQRFSNKQSWTKDSINLNVHSLNHELKMHDITLMANPFRHYPVCLFHFSKDIEICHHILLHQQNTINFHNNLEDGRPFTCAKYTRDNLLENLWLSTSKRVDTHVILAALNHSNDQECVWGPDNKVKFTAVPCQEAANNCLVWQVPLLPPCRSTLFLTRCYLKAVCCPQASLTEAEWKALRWPHLFLGGGHIKQLPSYTNTG